MRTGLLLIAVTALVAMAGCGGPSTPNKQLAGGREMLTVDFEEGKSLDYRFVARREVTVDWDPTKKRTASGRSTLDKSVETVDMVMSYKPVELNPYGLTTIEATCKSMKAERSKRTGGAGARDAVEHAAGKTFALKLDPAGKITDYSELEKLIKEMGEKAFRPKTERGRIKEPDMVGDFVATQWFLWDSVSSLPRPAEGVAVGDTWKSQLSIPSPMVMRKARDVTYTLKEVRKTPGGRLAVIDGAYELSETTPKTWPVPYSGRFQMAGTFGFLSGYKLLSLEGQGEEIFNIEAGRTERYNQQYEMQLDAFIPLGIDANPRITIKQTITMTLLNGPK